MACEQTELNGERGLKILLVVEPGLDGGDATSRVLCATC